MTVAFDMGALMADLPPLEDEIESIQELPEDRRLVRLAGIDVEISHDTATRRLMLTTIVGFPAADRRLEVYEAVLLYSLLWRDTGGVRMGLNGPGGEIVQMADIFSADAEPRVVSTMLRNLVSRTETWRRFIEAEPVRDLDKPQDAGFSTSEHVIRG